MQDGDVFAGRIGMAEASEFVIRHVVSLLTQLVDDQADITHGKELIAFTMGNIHG